MIEGLNESLDGFSVTLSNCNPQNISTTPMLTVTADDQGIQYGDPNPAFTFSYAGFLNGDDETDIATQPICQVTGIHTQVGTYPIVCSGGADESYNFNYISGTLTVGKLTVTPSISANDKTYDGTTSATFNCLLNDILAGDDVNCTDGTASFADKNVGPGKIVTAIDLALSGTDAGNYVLSFTSAIDNADITARDLSVSATATNKTYDGTTSATVNLSDNRVDGDDLLITYTSAFFLTPDVGSGKAVQISGISIAGGLNAGNYVLGNNMTTVTADITKAPIAVTANDQIIVSGDADPVFEFGYTGFVNDEDETDINTTPICGVSGLHTAEGIYPITCSGGFDENYSFIYVNGTLTVILPAEIDVLVGNELQHNLAIRTGASQRETYDNVDNGPVKVVSTNGVPIIASMRINLKTLPSYASYSEFMGIPASKLTDTYLFPWYNNATTGGLSSQLRFGNVGSDPTLVTVTIGGVERGSYPLDPNESARVTFDNVDAGPVEVTSSGGVPIIASMRINLKTLPSYSSYSEFMGLSASATPGTSYLFPWYNNATTGGLSSQLRFGNVGSDPTLVTVTIGGVERGSYPLDPNESARVTFDNVDAGPVEVTSSGGVPIIASMRINLKTLPSYASYSEFMGLPGAMLTETRYLFPWYNNATTGGLSSQLRFGNVGTDPTLVTVTIGGEVQDTYPLDPNESLRVTYDNVDAGPVEVTSSGGVPIIASMRINLKSLPAYSSYSEFMGLSVGSSVGMPGNELSSTYWFPWYNNATTGGLSSQLRFGVP